MVTFNILKDDIYCENPLLSSTAIDIDGIPAVPRLLTDKLLLFDVFETGVNSAESSQVDFQLSCP
jgi:hypothetical protein